MTKQSIQQKLERNGYKVTFDLGGKVLANKNSRTYSAGSLNELHRIIFG